jgi:hypothetical protein
MLGCRDAECALADDDARSDHVERIETASRPAAMPSRARTDVGIESLADLQPQRLAARSSCCMIDQTVGTRAGSAHQILLDWVCCQAWPTRATGNVATGSWRNLSGAVKSSAACFRRSDREGFSHLSHISGLIEEGSDSGATSASRRRARLRHRARNSTSAGTCCGSAARSGSSADEDTAIARDVGIVESTKASAQHPCSRLNLRLSTVHYARQRFVGRPLPTGQRSE